MLYPAELQGLVVSLGLLFLGACCFWGLVVLRGFADSGTPFGTAALPATEISFMSRKKAAKTRIHTVETLPRFPFVCPPQQSTD